LVVRIVSPGPRAAERSSQHGEDRGEPADRAREVEARGPRRVVERGLAPVALEVDEQSALPRPLRERVGERGQQEVVDLRAVGGARVLEQGARLVALEREP
jgi:hypothetical protein